MATDQSFADYVRDQMRAAGDVRTRKMFGEYAVYLDDKVVAFVCDNELYAKVLPPVQALLQQAVGELVVAPPFEGAKDYYRVTAHLDDHELMARLARTTADALPAPKARKSAAAKKSPTPAAPKKRR